MQFFCFHSQKGLSLIETVIAIFIITIGLIGGLSLAVSSTSTATKVKESTIAYSLAEEGLELVRNYRDSRWLEGEDIFGGEMAANRDSSSNYYRVDYTGLLGAGGDNKLYYRNGFYTHNSSGASQTPYSRIIRKRNLGGGDVRIISEVRWKSNTVRLEMHLFNWRQ